MNRLVIGGIAVLAAAGGGAWWMASRGGDGPAIAAATTAPAINSDAVPADPAADSSGDVADAGDSAAPDSPVIVAAVPTGSFTLERGVCFGPCPVYVATVTADDRLVFDGRKFTAREGRHERDLAEGSFERLTAIAARHDFASLDSKWPDAKGLNCPEPPTDLPTVSVTIDSANLKHAVRFYEGCAGYPGADRVVAMVKEFDGVLALADWVGPRDVWYGKRTP